MGVSSLVPTLPLLHCSISPNSPEISAKCRRVTVSAFRKSSAVAKSVASTGSSLPIRDIPGNYGLPLIGPVKDRVDYFYNEGPENFFRSRIEKYGSTVFRVNMPPGPFIAENPNVIALLDGKSFPVLFDTSRMEKKNIFTGTYMPSTELTGGHRVLSYLDPSELKHSQLKSLLFSMLKSATGRIFPEFHSTYSELFDKLESEVNTTGKADFVTSADIAAFTFLSRAFFEVNPLDTSLGNDAPKLIGKWVLFNLHPVLSLGLPLVPEDLLLHNIRLPPGLVKSDYDRLHKFFLESSSKFLDEAEKLGLTRDEASHNILFAICFNSFGGFKIHFTNMIKHIGLAGRELHTQLVREIRSAILSSGGQLTTGAIERMPLMKSVVYETFRLEPPVKSQYGKAKCDMVVESHDAAYEVKAGEVLFGFQPLATKDPRIFDRANEFVADRFIGDGEKLLKHVLWSNGPETESPTLDDKQCVGKDFVVLSAMLFVIELFRRFDTFEVKAETAALGSKVTLTSVTKASY